MNKIKKNLMPIIIGILIIAVGILSYFLYKKNSKTEIANTNLYNDNLYELINYVQNVETYLAKFSSNLSS